MTRINLGCGNDVREGYINVDWFGGDHPSIVRFDLSHFPWPFEDGSADQILILDFLEHFPYSQTRRILLECHRILHNDGEVVIQVPDAELLGRVISGMGTFPCNRCGQQFIGINNDSGDWVEHCSKCGQRESDIVTAAVHRMFGGQDFPGNFHQTCFTKDSLSSEAFSCGLYWNRYEEKSHQYANWNFKSVFQKGDIW